MSSFNFNDIHIGLNPDGQNTLAWYRSRLGQFTGSRISDLLGRKRGKPDEFSDTAISYIHDVAATRSMNNNIVEDDTLFQAYVDNTSVTTKAIEHGHEMEEVARDLYSTLTHNEVEVPTSVEHPTIPFFASSPDGEVKDEDGKVIGCVEIKCPSQSKFMQYLHYIRKGDDLLKVKKEYYYQCQSHMMVTGAQWCDFIAYCEYQRTPIHIVRVYPSAEAVRLIEQSINKANALVEEILSTKPIKPIKHGK